MIALFLAALVAMAAGGVLSVVPGRLVFGLWLQAAGALGFMVAGFWALADGGSWGASFTSTLTPGFGVDGLSAFFLGTLGLVAFPSLVFASAYLRPTGAGRATGLLTAGFVLSLAGVLCARDVLTFLLFWELMTLVPAAIILVGGSDRKARRSVFVYLAVTHIGTAGVWVALFMLADQPGFTENATCATSAAGQEGGSCGAR